MADETPLLARAALVNNGGVRKKLLASHAITRLGTQAWLFIAPLVLVRFTPNSIFGPAAWGMITMLATAFWGPYVGKWADTASRDRVITYGVVLQFVAVVGATATIIANAASLEQQDSAAANWPMLALFTAFGVVEKFGAMLSDVSVKREWTPQLFDGENQKQVNSKMSQIDLTTEVVGPFLAGLLITIGGFLPQESLGFLRDGNTFGFIVTGLLNTVSFIPQLALLRQIYQSHATLLQPIPAEERRTRSGPVPPEGAWATWWRHPGGLQFLSLSYALLYLTVLSPHGALLTALLQLRHVPSWQLSLLRGAGAVLGIAGTMARPGLGRCMGDRKADALGVIWLAAWMVVAMLSFVAANTESVQAVSPMLFLFMAAVCLGRPGLYSFELGVLNQEQELVDKRHRSLVGAVDNALTSLGTVAMYGSGMYWNTAEQFGFLVKCSAFFVASGAVTYVIWAGAYKLKRHRHEGGEEGGHGHEHGHSHSHGPDEHIHHPHTLQMLEMKEAREDGSFVHEHIVYDPGSCTIH